MVFVIPPKLVLPLSSLCGAFVTVLVAVQLEFFFSVGYPINLSLRAINAFSQRLFSAFGFLQLRTLQHTYRALFADFYLFLFFITRPQGSRSSPVFISPSLPRRSLNTTQVAFKYTSLMNLPGWRPRDRPCPAEIVPHNQMLPTPQGQTSAHARVVCRV